jgi:predicted RNA-binding protein YlqC (UPF0109 family)
VKELISYLACSLASRPDEVRVGESSGDRGLTLELTVADEDLNQLIGKQGRTAKAMRSLLAAASVRSGRRYFLKIVPASGDKTEEPAGAAGLPDDEPEGPVDQELSESEQP